MKRKGTKKHYSQRRKPQSHSITYIQYISIAFAVVAIIMAGKGILSATSKVHVLGASAGPVLLADHGSDDSGEGSSGGNSGGGDNNSGGGGSSGESSSNGSNNSNSAGGNTSGGSNSSGGGSNSGTSGSQSSVSNDTQVDCVGPDGKHFTTAFHDCQEFNQNWGHGNFTFTPLGTPHSTTPESESNPHDSKGDISNTQSNDNGQETPEKAEVKTENGKTELDIEKQGTELKIESEGDKLVVKAKQPDGTEIELNNENALEKLNETLKETGVTIASSPANTVEIEKDGVKAETVFPISVDPITHQLTITTPSGVKTVAILPDQAVANILKEKILTNITSQTTPTGTNAVASGTTKTTTLTELKNEPVFEVQGVNQKRILGLIPVGFAKTAFVSAITGQVVQTNESLINKILEALSF